MTARSPLSLSFALHFGAVLLLGLFVRDWGFKSSGKKVDIEVFEFPKPAPANLQIQPVKPEAKPKTEPKKAIFGVSRNSITADSGVKDAAEIKQGNTIAKEQDNLKLRPEDETSLPIPTDDYLVSSMPKLKSEVRIPYPVEARKAGVEGPVVMDLLIDAQGKVRQVSVVKGPGFGLNEAAEAALRAFEFSPAKVGEQAVAVKIRYTYRFVLENR